MILVQRSGIIGTSIAIYTAWAPSSLAGHHSTVRTFQNYDGWWGRIGSEFPPSYEEAYKAILEAFPEAANGVRDMGEITVYRQVGVTSEVRELKR